MAMEKSLNSSTEVTNISNHLVLRLMNNRMDDDPWLKEKLGYWFSLAQRIDSHSKKVIAFIEQLKKEEKNTNNQYRKLYKELKNYKNDIIILDSSFSYAYLTFPDLDNTTEEDFIKSFFSNVSAKAALVNSEGNQKQEYLLVVPQSH
jgi:hypothetical protein